MKKFDLLSFRVVMLFLATPLFLFQGTKISAPGPEVDNLDENLKKAVDLVDEMRTKIDQILESLKQTESDESKTRKTLEEQEEERRDDLKKEMMAKLTREDSTRELTRKESTGFSPNFKEEPEEDPENPTEDLGITPPPPL